MAILEKLRSVVNRRSAKQLPPLLLEPSGFRSAERFTVWSDVSQIAVFKRDMLTVDDVWFQLETSAGRVLVCEEQPGFPEWESAVIAIFPSVASWRQHVIHPPFADNFSALYQRT